MHVWGRCCAGWLRWMGLAMVATLLSGPPAHAAYYSKSTISFGELVRLRGITLPPAKVGVLHAFTVVDGARRRLPLRPSTRTGRLYRNVDHVCTDHQHEAGLLLRG